MVGSLTVSQYGFVPLKLELLNLDFQGLELDELFWRQRRQFLLKHPLLVLRVDDAVDVLNDPRHRICRSGGVATEPASHGTQ